MIDCYYTLTPPQFAEQSGEKTAASHLVCYKGVNLYVRPYDVQHYQVTGLATTNPACYLRKDLMPGALIPILGGEQT